VDRLKEFQSKLTEFLLTSGAEVLERIQRQAAIDDALTASLKTVAGQFKTMWA